jgi:hypothetical protein
MKLRLVDFEEVAGASTLGGAVGEILGKSSVNADII